MKANPAHSTGTGRKKRASTLPGTGMSAAEKVRRMAPSKRLSGILSNELNSKQVRSSGGMYLDYNQYNEYVLRGAQKQIDLLSTPTLVKLANSSSFSDKGVVDALSRVVNDSYWKRTFKNSIESVALDVAAYHHVLTASSRYNDAIGSSTPLAFETVYELTGYTPGSLATLDGDSKKSIEALIFVVIKEGHFSGHTFTNQTIVVDYFSLIGAPPAEKREFPKELATRIMENPDCADTLAEYMNKNMQHAADVNWSDFLEYLDIAAPLREGAL